MAEPTNETGVVNRIVKAVKKKYPSAWIFKVHGGPMQMVGVPDLLLIVHGRIIGAEVKFQRPGESLEHAKGRASPTQRVQIQKIIRAGGMAGVVTSVEETFDLIDRAFLKHEHNEKERDVTRDHSV